MDGPFSLLDGHEQVVFGNDPETGLRCIIAIYSTALGPALGGTRFYPYASEEDALVDVLRLSKGMAYKAACAGLDLGGGKAVIIGDPQTDKTEALLRAYGRMVESLNGRYVTACDVGTYTQDLAIVARETRWATGTDVVEGGSGDSSILTAYGTYLGIKACLEHVFDSGDVGNRHVAIQGVGKVGMKLAEHLHTEGARLTVSDVNDAATAMCEERFGAEVVANDKIHAVDADVYSPNPTTRSTRLMPTSTAPTRWAVSSTTPRSRSWTAASSPARPTTSCCTTTTLTHSPRPGSCTPPTT